MITAEELVRKYRESIGKYTYDDRDCIKSIYRILEQYGARAGAVGSNYFARNVLRNIRPLKSRSQLYDGCAVLKTVLPGEPGYALPKGYSGHVDQIDYNHIGIGTDEGEILDSTRYGKRPDGSWERNGPGVSTAPINSRSWDIIADFPPNMVDYGNREQEGVETVAQGIAQVVAESGSTVKLRAKANSNAKTVVLEYVPIGTDVVTIGQRQGDWLRVRTPSGTTGWMMSKFLQEEQRSDAMGPPGEHDSAAVVSEIHGHAGAIVALCQKLGVKV